MIELGKTYPLKDGSGTGEVYAIRYLVRIRRPGKRYHGEIRTYTPEGECEGCMAWETPALVADRPVAKIEAAAFDMFYPFHEFLNTKSSEQPPPPEAEMEEVL